MCTDPQNLLLVALCPIIGMPSLGVVGIIHFKDKKIKTWSQVALMTVSPSVGCNDL